MCQACLLWNSPDDRRKTQQTVFQLIYATFLFLWHLRPKATSCKHPHAQSCFRPCSRLRINYIYWQDFSPPTPYIMLFFPKMKPELTFLKICYFFCFVHLLCRQTLLMSLEICSGFTSWRPWRPMVSTTMTDFIIKTRSHVRVHVGDKNISVPSNAILKCTVWTL